MFLQNRFNLITVLLIIFSVIIIFSGCVNSSETTFPRSLSLRFNVSDVGDTITDVDGDTLIVREVKIHLSRFSVATTDGDTLESALNGGLIARFSETNLGADENVLISIHLIYLKSFKEN